MAAPAPLTQFRRAFVPLALLWLPLGVAATPVVRGMGLPVEPQAWLGLVMIAPCGLPLALACRWLWRLGNRRGACIAGILLGTVTVMASLLAGLFGPFAIALSALILSLPVWAVCWCLTRWG